MCAGERIFRRRMIRHEDWWKTVSTRTRTDRHERRREAPLTGSAPRSALYGVSESWILIGMSPRERDLPNSLSAQPKQVRGNLYWLLSRFVLLARVEVLTHVNACVGVVENSVGATCHAQCPKQKTSPLIRSVLVQSRPRSGQMTPTKVSAITPLYPVFTRTAKNGDRRSRLDVTTSCCSRRSLTRRILGSAIKVTRRKNPTTNRWRPVKVQAFGDCATNNLHHYSLF